MSTRYGLNLGISSEEYHKQSRGTPQANKASFEVSKEDLIKAYNEHEQAIKNAQESWDTLEVLQSLEKEKQRARFLSKQEKERVTQAFIEKKKMRMILLHIEAHHNSDY